MSKLERIISSLRRPPALQNWVRLNHRRREDTTKSIVRFALGKPRHTLANVYTIIADYVTYGVSRDMADKGIERITNPLVRRLGREIIGTLLPWLDKQELKGIQVFHNLVVPFPIGRGVVVPVKPTFVFQHDKKLVPVFIIGWTSMPFDGFQKSLLCTIIRNAVLTLEGFRDSDAHIVFVPRLRGSRSERYVRPFKVSEIELLSDDQLRAQFDRFGNSMDEAVPLVLEELAKRGEL